MTSRLTLVLTLVSLSLSLLASDPVPTAPLQPTVPLTHSADLIKLHIDKQRAHYDFEHCGRPTAGRARRGFGDDYVDGLNFDLADTVEADAAVGEMPWAVAVITRVPGHSARLCSGTLVSRRHVLSAAHCLSSSDEIPTNFGHARCKTTDHIDLHDFIDYSVVKYGGECLNGADSACDESMITKQAKVKNITLFPFFREDCSRGSDLVIFELDQDVDAPHACLSHLTEMVHPSLRNTTFPSTTTKKPDPRNPPTEAPRVPLPVIPFHTFKWQADKSKGVDSAQRLQKVAPLTLRQDRCANRWRSISPDVLCAAPAKHIAQCLGESGAGLITVSGGRSFLIGVLSSTSGCAPVPEVPEVPESRFTDVRLFTSTIDRALGTVGPMPDFSDVIVEKKTAQKSKKLKKMRPSA